MLAEQIAEVCYEANRAYCQTIGDYSFLAWPHAQQWQRDTNIAGVRKILGGEITTPEQSHESWLAKKEEDGWVYGEVKDVAAKTHPCMLPYAKLPPEQRRKDDIFFAIVTALKPAVI